MATGMAATTFRGDRRGPMPQNRHGGRNNYNPPRQNMRRSANNMQHHHHHPHPQQQQPPPVPQVHHQQIEDFLAAMSSGDTSVYKNERCVRALMHMVGNRIVVRTANNGEFEGVFSAVSGGMDIELKEARTKVKPDGTAGTRHRSDSTFVNARDIMVCSCPNLDIGIAKNPQNQKYEFMTDTAISGANGSELKLKDMKPLVEWNEDGDAPEMTLESDDSAGWSAESMFKLNEEKFNVQTSYRENLEIYTTPIPKFSSEEAQKEAETIAAKKAYEIESSEGYRKRMNVENNTDLDEETRYSAVARSTVEPSSSQAYIPPARRQQQAGHNPQLGPRGPVPAIPSHQPLPQRNRDRGDRNHHEQRGGVEGERLPRNLPTRNPAPVPAPPRSQGSSAAAQPSREGSDRLSGERRSDGPGRGGYPSRTDHQGSPAPHHSVHQSVAVTPVSPEASHQPSQAQALPPAPNHHTNYNHVPSSPVGPPVPSSVAPPGPPAQMPPNSLPSLMQMQASRGNAQAPIVSPPVVGSQQNVKPPSQAESREAGSLPPTYPNQQQAVANTSATTSTEKMSPREKDRQEKLNSFKEFHSNFKLQGDGEPRPSTQGRPQEKPGENEAKGQSSPVTVSSPPRGASVTTPVSTEGAAVQSPPTSQGTSIDDTVTKTSTLNPNATEFRPRQPQPPPPQPPSVPAVQQIASPAPSGTPPSQGPRQSPSMMSQPALMPYNAPFIPHKMVTVNQNQQQKTYQHPKRAVVSVDPVALAATGQPLTLGGAQAATMQQPSYVYVPPTTVLPQYHPVPMRVMQSIPQGAGMDPNLGAPGQQPHPVAQPFIMTQQPVPAHMPTAQALTQNMPQPVHPVHQHLPQHSIQSNMQPASQNSVNPLPAASPVQHLGGNGPPQMNHTQGAPPTSSTPQSGMYGHQMPGLLPPQGAAGHTMPAHTVAQGPTPGLQFLHQHHQMPGTVSFTQTGATGASGPAPAHVQQAGHVNQTHHVVVMPQPPAQAVNQTALNNPSHHHQQQHSAAAAQFQQQLQGASSQLHGPVGPSQHLIQGNVPAAGGGMGVHPPMQHYVPQVQGSHGHHHLGHSQAGHSHGHGHSHSHSHGHGHNNHPHYQGP